MTAVRVVIVHRNQPVACAQTVRAFAAQSAEVRVTVVDNASAPEALSAVRAAVPQADVLALEHNAGFGPAANAGLRRWLADESSEWAVVAPHDAQPAPGALPELIRAASRRPRAGLACADYGDRLRPSVDRYLGGILAPAGAEGDWIPTDHPHGTMLACRRSCLADVGLFDERYFAYVEEADLGMRAVAAGWDVGVVATAVVRNPTTTVSRPVVEYLQLRNTLLLLREHFGLYPVSVRVVIALVSTAHQTLRASKRAPWFHPRARLRAIVDFLAGRFGAPSDAVLALR
jgi:GT2 family glycosyltransferase